MPSDLDPFISEHIVAIRNRFGVRGLRDAAAMIAVELAIFGNDDDAALTAEDETSTDNDLSRTD